MSEVSNYPLNAILDLLYPLEHPAELPVLAADHEIGYQFLLSRLPEHTRDILEKRYHDHMTLKAIGEEVHLSPERIRQICHSGQKMMRKDHTIRCLTHGFSNLLQETQTRAFNEGKNEGYKKGFDEAKVTLAKKWITFGDVLQDMKVADLELGTRAKNSLKNNHVYSVQDLLSFPPSRLKEARGIGETVYQEIMLCLQTMGLERMQAVLAIEG